MNQDQHRKIIYLAAFLPLSALLLIILSDPHNNPARDWIKEWETLITGFIAILAAVFTIYETRRMDDRQQQRHLEVINLSIRPDRLRIQRVTTPYLVELYRQMFWCRGYPSEIRAKIHAIHSGKEEDLVNEIFWFASQVRENVLPSDLESIRDLFDEKIDYAYRDLWTRIKMLEDTASERKKIGDPTKPPFFIHVVSGMGSNFELLYDGMIKFQTQIERLRRLYAESDI